MIKKLIILSLAVTVILATATPGADVQCNTNDQTSCGSSGGSTWAQGTNPGKSKIADCGSIGSSLSNVYDTLCTSCVTDSKNYANSAKNGCQTTVATPGAVVPCQASGACTTCGSISPAFAWSIPSGDTTNCIITSCLAAPFPTSNLIDNFCKSCGGASGTYANSYGTSCVASTATCQNTRSAAWTDSDCQKCNAGGANSANQYAAADSKSCVSTKPSSSSSSSVIVFSCLIVASLLI
ncbi:cell surface immobilization antigen (macronuclear) [Tetrahymena thermophila SB210]|uniref:Cell surface immobilization antigen n=1 Tax=Tetrahymena thermophila (strain SB210) TaxID=312017 RepID=Q23JC6_TETTS|nr:cell surface immobilization antigen [Tetrahymena thermophila SB210]EAR96578.1 cell surface immobilization antigen [Tetrahymena thermophila SB210]|eukprot:XP_001016823.1 cell surface immobilization antigen [Tetrahymena thermophila SB210]